MLRDILPTRKIMAKLWSGGADLNCRPLAPQASALNRTALPPDSTNLFLNRFRVGPLRRFYESHPGPALLHLLQACSSRGCLSTISNTTPFDGPFSKFDVLRNKLFQMVFSFSLKTHSHYCASLNAYEYHL